MPLPRSGSAEGQPSRLRAAVECCVRERAEAEQAPCARQRQLAVVELAERGVHRQCAWAHGLPAPVERGAVGHRDSRRAVAEAAARAPRVAAVRPAEVVEQESAPSMVRRTQTTEVAAPR